MRTHLIIQSPLPAPWLSALLNVTLALVAFWVVVTLFRAWRRHVTQLTPTETARIDRKRAPDFLTVDTAARDAAIARADAFDAELSAREREEAEEARESAGGRTSRLAALATLFMSIFSLSTLITGAVWQVSWIGTVMDDYSTPERILAVLKTHPVAFAVCFFVILYHVIEFFLSRKWREASF